MISKKLLSNILPRCIAFLLAVLILNCSIDTPDGQLMAVNGGTEYTEDLRYNDMESFYELVTEGLLDLEDFVPEHDNDSSDTDKQGKSAPFWLYSCEPPVAEIVFEPSAIKYPPDRLQFWLSATRDISPVPPDAPACI